MSNISKKLIVFATAILGCVALSSASVKIYSLSQIRKDNYETGLNYLRNGDCDRAMENFDSIETHGAFLDRFDRLSTEVQPYKLECSTWQSMLEEIKGAVEQNDLASVLIGYNSFVGKHPVSLLVAVAKQRVEQLFNDVEVPQLVSDRSCQQIDSVLKHDLISEPDLYLPSFYLGCIEVYQQREARGEELKFQTVFLSNYYQHEGVLIVKQGLIQNPLACINSEKLQQNQAIAEGGNLMSVLYLACGKAYQEVRDYNRAIAFYQSVATYYPDDELVRQAQSNIASIDREIKAIAKEMLVATSKIEERIAACTAGAIFVDWLIDLGEIISGKDCMTGQSLHAVERFLTAIPFVDGMNNVSKLSRVWQVIDTVATFTQVQQTQNLLQDRQSLFDLLGNVAEMELLTSHNSNLIPLVANFGKTADLSEQHAELVKLLN